MAMDGLMLRAVTNELSELFCGGRLQKSYQPRNEEIILHIYNKVNYRLLLNCNAQDYRAHITTHSGPNPAQAPLFCMLLRKHLDGGRIVSIEQPGLERCLHITFSSYDELGNLTEKKLICELMGKHSNIILTHAESGNIIDAVKRIPFGVSRVRQILPGFTYVAPPSEKRSILDLQSPPFQLEPLDANALVDQFEGISPLIARELMNRYSDFATLSVNLRKMIAENAYEPAITTTPQGKVYCGALRYHHISDQSVDYESMNACLDHFYFMLNNQRNIAALRQSLHRVVKKEADRQLRTMKKQQKEFSLADKAQNSRRKADLIKANLYQIEAGQEIVEVTDYYDPQLPTIKIELIPHLSPQANLKQLYKAYEKAVRTIADLEKRLMKTTAIYNYLDSVLTMIKTAGSVEDLMDIRQELIEEGYITEQPSKKKSKKVVPKKLPPRHFLSSDGYTIAVGRNNRQNDQLTLRLAAKTDLWFHTKDLPGAHVVIKDSGGKEVPDQTMEEAAMLAAYYSKARDSATVPVDYTRVKHVFKQRNSHPGQVHYTHQHTIYITPDESKLPQLQIEETLE